MEIFICKSHMVMSQDQNARRSHNIKIDNSSFERVEEFSYLGKTLTIQNSIQEEIKSRLKSGNACYHLVQNLLSSSLLSKNFEDYDIQNYNFAFCLNGGETWSFTLREECRLRVFENTVLRRIFRPKRDKVTGDWIRLHNEELNDLYCSPNIVRVIKSRRMRWAGHVAFMEEGRGVHKVLVGKPEGEETIRETKT